MLLRIFRGLIAGMTVLVLFIPTVARCQGSANPHREASGLDGIKVPPGFRIALYTSAVPGARSMTLGTNGTLFVGTQDEGNVYAVVDTNHDGRADKVYTVGRGLQTPNGVAFRNGSLYVAEIDRILRYDDIEKHLDKPPRPAIVIDSYPSDRSHGWKFIAFGPDGLLYVPVGAPCNVCRTQGLYGTITRVRPDGTGREVFATGVRNSVGFDWSPVTHELWFTDNGRDELGDNRPPDELNHAPARGMNFGFPYCHGGDISDPELGAGHPCSGFKKPEVKLGPHVAALGMRFYTGTMFPAKYRGGIFIAEHGSWNRSDPIGYRVTFVRMEGNRAAGYETFAEGWLTGRSAWGRPVDVQMLPDGSLLVSDDKAGAIYRITSK